MLKNIYQYFFLQKQKKKNKFENWKIKWLLEPWKRSKKINNQFYLIQFVSKFHHANKIQMISLWTVIGPHWLTVKNDHEK